MVGFLNFGEFIINSFSGFFEWFFNGSITIGTLTIFPYQIFGFGTLVVIIGLLIVRLVVGG